MITIFNRKELILTWEMKKQLEIRNILSANNIDYTISVKNMLDRNSFGRSARSHYGSMGINAECLYEYKIYVNKKDYEQAVYLIRNV